MRIFTLCATSFLAMLPMNTQAQPAQQDSRPTTLDVRDVGAIEGVETTLMVPENRQDPASRMIALRYVTLPAINPTDAAPVIYLAGGPGGSATGTARSRRWPLFDALRQSRDVILLDQRGTGLSDAPPPCATSIGWSPDEAGTRDTFIAKQRAAFEQCVTFWKGAGVDLKGYTTAQSAADIRAVSQAVGGKVSLLGISYGTHLALATLKDHADVVDRAVLVSVEGLDQTVKLPARTDAFFTRWQSALDDSAKAAGGAGYPNLSEALRKALSRIEKDRPLVEVFVARGRPPVKRTLGAFAVQTAIAFSMADPRGAHATARAIIAMASDEPDYSFMQYRGFVMPEQIRMRAMPMIMDLASGVSTERLAMIEEQAKTAILSDATNFPMPHLNAQDAPYQLPDSFRVDPVAETPALVISGTLDGRTYPESGQEATAGLANRVTITVENAGHNLFFNHPDIVPSIVRFLDKDPMQDTRLIAPLPKP